MGSYMGDLVSLSQSENVTWVSGPDNLGVSLLYVGHWRSGE